jgi:hypothetical protein
MAYEWKESNGKKYLHVDYREFALQEDKVITLLESVAMVIKAEPPGCLIFNNWEGVAVGRRFMNRVKELGKAIFVPRNTLVANIGISGTKTILAKAYDTYTGNKNNGYFHSEREALDWLTRSDLPQ